MRGLIRNIIGFNQKELETIWIEAHKAGVREGRALGFADGLLAGHKKGITDAIALQKLNNGITLQGNMECGLN